VNTKEGTGTRAWLEDSAREKAVDEGSLATRCSPNLSNTNTRIITCCEKNNNKPFGSLHLRA